MKRLARISVILFSLLGVSMPVQANNGMTDMMRIMMEMFLWMMGGGSGMNPYRMGGPGAVMGNPLMANPMLGNPFPSNSFLNGSGFGYPSGWGNGLPNSIQSLYSPPGYPGSAANYNPYANPYSRPYYNNTYRNPYSSPYYGYGNQAYPRGNYSNPYRPNQHPLNSPYSSPYYSGQQGPAKPPVTTEYEKRPSISSQATPVESVVPDFDSNYQIQSNEIDNPLYGSWQGVNGEYLELGSKRFRLRSNDVDLEGTYELKNSILKAEIADRKEPVYMQYRMSDGHLMFRSEDGQLMLLRRLSHAYQAQ